MFFEKLYDTIILEANDFSSKDLPLIQSLLKQEYQAELERTQKIDPKVVASKLQPKKGEDLKILEVAQAIPNYIKTYQNVFQNILTKPQLDTNDYNNLNNVLQSNSLAWSRRFENNARSGMQAFVIAAKMTFLEFIAQKLGIDVPKDNKTGRHDYQRLQHYIQFKVFTDVANNLEREGKPKDFKDRVNNIKNIFMKNSSTLNHAFQETFQNWVNSYNPMEDSTAEDVLNVPAKPVEPEVLSAPSGMNKTPFGVPFSK